MSAFSHVPYHLPFPSALRINLGDGLPSYRLLRSFGKNWSSELGRVSHIPIFRPALDLVAGDHYFEGRTNRYHPPRVSLLISLSPSHDFETPLIYTCNSSRFDGLSCYIHHHSIPKELPPSIREDILDYIHDNGVDLVFFLDALDAFFFDSQKPTSPNPNTIPLGNHQ